MIDPNIINEAYEELNAKGLIVEEEDKKEEKKRFFT
jgi:DNA-binding transcriptional regulator YhcF (GntR family)